ncbi:MAG: carbohydrate ABC transporter permease [Armatimonadota bacterium]|nr:carbohydrate ABC transporter permease [bacterium]
MKKSKWITTLTYAALIIFGTSFTLPFFWLISTSFKPAARIQKWPPDILPMQQVYAHQDGKSLAVYIINAPDKKAGDVLLLNKLKEGNALVKYADNPRSTPMVVSFDNLTEKAKPGLEWKNYTKGLTFIPFLQELRNTLTVSILSVIGTILSCSLVAYGLAKIDWHGRNSLFIIMLSTMMLPAQVTMIPIFAIFVKLGWVDTFLPLIIPAFLGSPFFIFLLRQFFMGIPKELSEAARLDGCSEFDIYRRVVMPLSKPALATVGLFTFMGAWNDFLGPLIYLVDESKYTLSLGLAMFTGQYGNEYGMLMAVSTVVTIPIIVMFFFTQKTFIQGMTMSGIKG